MHELKVEYRSINDVTPYEGNARAHGDEQIKQIERSIMRWGFYNPIEVDQNGVIIAGHGRLTAAKNLGFKDVPVIQVHCETEADRRALTIVDNSIAENATWDEQLLKIEAEFLRDIDGFELEELALDPVFLDELLLTDDDEDDAAVEEEENVPEPPADPISCVGDLWICGKHKVLCGDSTKKEDYEKLFGPEELADMVFTDPPYNVDYGRTEETRARGKTRHGETIAKSKDVTEEMKTLIAEPQAEQSKPKAKVKPKAKPEKKPRKSGIKERFIEMLKRADGATDDELVKEFGWKGPHVSRGRRSTLAKEMQETESPHMICKFTRTPSGETAYKIDLIEDADQDTKEAV